MTLSNEPRSRRTPSTQADALKLNKPVLVVGTPGRLAELSREGALQVPRAPASIRCDSPWTLTMNPYAATFHVLEDPDAVYAKTSCYWHSFLQSRVVLSVHTMKLC